MTLLLCLMVLFCRCRRKLDIYFTAMFYSPDYSRTINVNQMIGDKGHSVNPKPAVFRRDPHINVTIFMSVRYKTPPEYFQCSSELASRYAIVHGYEFRIIDHGDDPTTQAVSPYWLRVVDMIRLTNTYPEDHLFLYIDADAVINPTYQHVPVERVAQSLDNVLQTSYDVYVGSDPPGVIPGRNESVINTGVMILRNTRWTRMFLQRWWNRYDTSRWSVSSTTGGWSCKQPSGLTCIWAGTNYEQGELNNMRHEDPTFLSGHLLVCHWVLLASDGEGYIVHLMGNRNETRYKRFAKYLESKKPYVGVVYS